ncbi:hypothetical protein K450DRAFT_260923 [Umbelopsis ramanniana AG]|uniref:Arrestin C-terminal-like domain-containing protein n=1 Tax=Umbelopsis ramanniana AG TaxID=1314678 RepID=A0AAD5E2G8_UMBRA|nr:uncharacterized protein K450DRAFT_260923 [Umbelopsis ramanniana AG]KAI8575614.1 hypothetical protein K450DRAFT_260923 [Umbelopsis ramanniana AG]
MRKQAKFNKNFNVRLDEDKFYFPGERIRGTVSVFPTKPTRTNHIRVIFKGEIASLLKDKESITLFNKVKILPISKDDESSAKSHILEAKSHTFPFDFLVPEDIALPSSMEVFKYGRIRYTLIAIHDKPMVPESLSPKATYNVPILEHIDISVPEYTRPTEKSVSTTLEGVEDRRKITVKANIPRYGYTRGDIVPLNLSIGHHSPFSREKGIKVEFVRVGHFSSNRQMVANEITLRTSESNINIYGPYNFSQSLTEQIMIPTSTPPTIDKKGKIIYINYKVRVTVNLNSKHSAKRQNIVTVELPIVVGTWPRAAVPIDEDDEWIDGMDSMMLSDEEAPADNDSLYDYSTSEQNFVPDIQHNTSSSSASLMLHNQGGLRQNPEWRLSTSSTSSSTSSANAAARANLSTNYPITTDNGVFRSDSNASKVSVRSAASVSSNKSSRSLETNQDRLTRNTSVSTTASAPEQPTASGRYVRNTPVQAPPAPPPPPPFSQPALIKAHASYIPRSSSATDLNRQPHGVPSPLPFVQQPPYDDGGLYRHRGVPPPTNENLHDSRFRGGRSANDTKRYHSMSDSNYHGVPMNGNNSHMPYPPSANMYDHGPAPNGFLPTANNYAGQAGRHHMRTPSDLSHMYHTQPNYPTAAKFTPMPAVPDTQRTMYPFSQDDAIRTNHHPTYPNMPQFTPPRQFDSQNGLPHRHSDPQAQQPGAVIHTPPVMRSGSDPSAYLNRDDKALLETPSSAAPEVEPSVVEPHGYYDSSDSSSEFGDAAGSASDDSDDSDDEGDLLRIVEKKRRQEQKQMRRRQRRVFTIAE